MRLKDLRNTVEKAPPDYDRMVEYFPNAFGSLDRKRVREKQEAVEKART